jgi:hypothetical protein
MAAWLHAIDSDGLVVNGVNSVSLPQMSKSHPLHDGTAREASYLQLSVMLRVAGPDRCMVGKWIDKQDPNHG